MTATALWAYLLAQVAERSTHPAELLAGAAVAVAALLTVAIAGQFLSWPYRTGDPGRLLATARQRIRQGGVPRQLDPDAAGRPRPRAPSPLPSAA